MQFVGQIIEHTPEVKEYPVLHEEQTVADEQVAQPTAHKEQTPVLR
jgi:hypothetical protein